MSNACTEILLVKDLECPISDCSYCILIQYYCQVSVVVVGFLYISSCEAAKGGAKSIMRGRKGQGGANSGTFAGYYGHNSYYGQSQPDQYDNNWEDDYDGSGDEYDGSGDDYEEEVTPPCVGEYSAC